MWSKILGRAKANEGSKNVEKLLSEGEEILKSFKIWRDELVMTNKGLYQINKRGITGKNSIVTYITSAQIIGWSFDNAFALKRSMHLEINLRSERNFKIKVRKEDEDVVLDMILYLKDKVIK